MNYSRIYNELINKRKQFIVDDNIYSEKHHIIPKSLGGSDNISNIVKLTAREHYIAHMLLVEIHKNDKNSYAKMLHSFMYMNCVSGNQKRYLPYNSRFYA